MHPIYLSEKCIPGGTNRNFDSYGHKIGDLTPFQRAILCDPQTSGGLLVAVKPEKALEFAEILRGYHLPSEVLGTFVKRREKLVYVE